MIFGQWKPGRIGLAALLFGLFRALSNVYMGFSFLTALNIRLRVQHDAVYHLASRAGLYLEKLPRSQGGGHTLRQRTAIDRKIHTYWREPENGSRLYFFCVKMAPPTFPFGKSVLIWYHYE
jgi:nucleoside ABC transporter membrane protein